ncbi:SpoIIE family protein phosphatase [Kitasatospora sp. NPDC018058]|uniref:SpoIIE family protein phosphatase n=1 Tax=Kitasatospora sp. NPDC018058 TaxID=3364025 RepID=UPI0037BE2566
MNEVAAAVADDRPMAVTCSRDATVLMFTDGLVEHPDHPIDERLVALADLAAAHAHQSLDDLVRTLADHHSSDGHDDMAVLAIRTPTKDRPDRLP